MPGPSLTAAGCNENHPRPAAIGGCCRCPCPSGDPAHGPWLSLLGSPRAVHHQLLTMGVCSQGKGFRSPACCSSVVFKVVFDCEVWSQASLLMSFRISSCSTFPGEGSELARLALLTCPGYQHVGMLMVREMICSWAHGRDSFNAAQHLPGRLGEQQLNCTKLCECIYPCFKIKINRDLQK